MRLERSLRPPRLLRFPMPVCKVHAVFSFLEAKEAVEVIEASDVIMSAEVIEATEVFKNTQILKVNNILARITLF
jgi:hypothetical protein